MLVFIDESGDAGFKIEDGSTPIFVAAMVIFADAGRATETSAVIVELRRRLAYGREFKFNKAPDRIRDAFFLSVRNCPFSVRAIVVRKNAIHSQHLKTDKEDFYRYFVRLMMANDNGALDAAKVVIDGSGDRTFRQMLNAALRRQLGSRVRAVKFANSAQDNLVQLADMCVGAIARSYRRDRDNAQRWRVMLQPRIDNVWNFR